MLPFITVFGRTVPMYGTMTAVGVLLAIIYAKFVEKKYYRDLSPDLELILIFALIGAGVGAKMLSLAPKLPELLRDLPLLFTDLPGFGDRYLSGGFVFYGGFYGCLAAVWLYCRAAKISADRVLQMLFPIFPLIHGFGRIGCFCVGCCYGIEAGSFPLAVAFRHSPIAPNGLPLIPVQLIEAAAELLLFLLLAVLSRKISGTALLALYCGIYALMRFLLEFLRGDDYRGFLFGLSTSQLISIATLGFALALLYRIRNTKRAASEP